jgi:hypothetical protein
MISQSAAKYGRKLKSIALGTNPIQTKIYNQNVIKDIQINRITEPVLNSTKYVTSFSTNAEISITTETVNPSSSGETTLQNTGTSNQQIYSNGLGRVLIPESVAFLKFTLFQKENGQNTRMNLAGLGDLYIVFDSSQGENLEFIEFPNQYTSKGGGEVIFRLSENDTRRVLALTNRSFRIFIENDQKDRTFLYAGDFFSTSEFQDIQKNSKIADLETQVVTLTSQLQGVNSVLDQQKTTIDSLNSTNQQLQSAANQPVLTPVTATTTVEDVISQVSRVIGTEVMRQTGMSMGEANILAGGLCGMAQAASWRWLRLGRPIPMEQAIAQTLDLAWHGLGAVTTQVSSPQADILHLEDRIG